jgi:hypothetical protein
MTDETDNATKRAECISGLGLTYTAEFVPQSHSRNKDNKEPSINWRVTIARNGQSLTTDYMQGIGHAPGYRDMQSAVRKLSVNGRLTVDAQYARAEFQRIVCEIGRVPTLRWAHKYIASDLPLSAPALLDVLYSLTLDSDAITSGGFEEWAKDYGYDTDSRKAEAIYRQCIEIGLKLQHMIGADNLATLRELFQDY